MPNGTEFYLVPAEQLDTWRCCSGREIRHPPRAWRQVERERKWWEANREKAPGLFVEELAEAERHLTTLPESGELWRIRRKRTIRRWLLDETAAQHLYYMYSREREEVLVLMLWSARRGRGPKL